MEVTLHDSEGKEIIMPDCQCGKPSETFIAGKEHIKYTCNDCLFGKQDWTSHFIYRPPNGKE